MFHLVDDLTVTEIQEIIRQLKRDHSNMLTQITIYEQLNIENDQFVKVIKPFTRTSNEKLNFLDNKFNLMLSSLENLAILYNEDILAMKTNPTKFFNNLKRFFKLF